MLETIRASMLRLIESMKSIWQESYHGMHRFAEILFCYFCTVPRKKSKPPALPTHDSIIRTAALINIGLSPPAYIREFVVYIRRINLQKHQRKSTDSEDFNDSFTLAHALT